LKPLKKKKKKKKKKLIINKKKKFGSIMVHNQVIWFPFHYHPTLHLKNEFLVVLGKIVYQKTIHFNDT